MYNFSQKLHHHSIGLIIYTIFLHHYTTGLKTHTMLLTLLHHLTQYPYCVNHATKPPVSTYKLCKTRHYTTRLNIHTMLITPLHHGSHHIYSDVNNYT